MVKRELNPARHLNDHKTISDSKRAFNKAFPYVIPALYRGFCDELLVELHLLSHQRSFKPDVFFAIGVSQAFNTFMRGYRPESHLEPLLRALCECNGFEHRSIRDQSTKALEAVKTCKLEQVKTSIRNNSNDLPLGLLESHKAFTPDNFHYSRIKAIGLITLLSNTSDKDLHDEKVLNQITIELLESIGVPKSRIEKDLNLYSSNLERMAQAMDLIKDAKELEKRKKERISQGTNVEKLGPESLTASLFR